MLMPCCMQESILLHIWRHNRPKFTVLLDFLLSLQIPKLNLTGYVLHVGSYSCENVGLTKELGNVLFGSMDSSCESLCPYSPRTSISTITSPIAYRFIRRVISPEDARLPFGIHIVQLQFTFYYNLCLSNLFN